MVPSRRAFLAGGAAAAAALAGCSGTNTGSGDPGTSVESGSGSKNVVRDPPHLMVRTDASEEPPVWVEPSEGGTDADGDGRPVGAAGRVLLDSPSAADRVGVADDVDAESVRTFLRETVFDEETVYLVFRPVRACYRLELCHVTWSDSDVETQFGGYYRDADVACERDVREGVSVLIRIPDALHPEQVSSYGGGWSGGGCPLTRAERAELERRDEAPPRQIGPPPRGSSRGPDSESGSAADASTNATDGAVGRPSGRPAVHPGGDRR
jgi:hypothetical protein